MKIKSGIGILILLTLAFFGCDPGNGEDPYEGPQPDPYYSTFKIGVAVPGANTSNNSSGGIDNNALNPESKQYPLLEYFDVYAAENEMKPINIMPSSAGGAYNWTNADALVSYAESKGKRVRGHVLVWHDQSPSWLFSGTAKSGLATKDELYERMENHIKTVFEKYGNRIDIWDVCNEVIDHNVYTDGGARKDSKYTQIMEESGLTGMDRFEYVLKAFEWARKYANDNGGKDVKLYLTDYGVERPFTGQTAGSKQNSLKELVEWLVSNGAPIDGVGFQGHFRLYDHPVNQISDGIDLFAGIKNIYGKNITVQVCELDYSVFSGAKSESNDTEIASDKLAERLTDLATNYGDFFTMFKTKFNEGKLDLVVIWGLSDGFSWLNNSPVPGRTDHPLLFDREFKRKEAFYAVFGEEKYPRP